MSLFFLVVVIARKGMTTNKIKTAPG